MHACLSLHNSKAKYIFIYKVLCLYFYTYMHVSLSCNSHGVPNMIVSVALTSPHGGFEVIHVYIPSALELIELIICGEETNVPPGVNIEVEPIAVHVKVTSSPGKGQRSKITEGASGLEQPSLVPRSEIVPTKESIEGLAVKQIYIHHTKHNECIALMVQNTRHICDWKTSM